MPERLLKPAAEGRPDSAAASDGGRLVASRHLELVGPETPTLDFTAEETSVLSLISEGNTAAQIARQLDMGEDDVRNNRSSAMTKSDTPSITATVDGAIKDGVIPIEVEEGTEAISRLSPLDIRMLKFYAKGGSNRQIAKTRGLSLREIEAYHDELLEKVGAWSRPHAIRRAYELGIFAA